MKLRIVLLIISLSLLSCGSIPPFPEVFQCAYSIRFDKFRCVNTQTKEEMNLRRDNAIMEGAQCMSADDYKKSERWVSEVKALAEKRCH